MFFFYKLRNKVQGWETVHRATAVDRMLMMLPERIRIAVGRLIPLYHDFQIGHAISHIETGEPLTVVSSYTHGFCALDKDGHALVLDKGRYYEDPADVGLRERTT